MVKNEDYRFLFEDIIATHLKTVEAIKLGMINRIWNEELAKQQKIMDGIVFKCNNMNFDVDKITRHITFEILVYIKTPSTGNILFIFQQKPK